ncbi:MAG: LysM peptidoglycan-binding domain-containing protein [Chloroflexota bacterium]|nr:LysM peptidoglycan-binding domain-containing protein [Chloroflexota bacterium]
MKKTRSTFLSIVGLSVVLILAAGCYRPAAPDVTTAPAGEAEASPLETPDVQATAIANATEAAETRAAQTSEGEEPAEASAEPTSTEMPEPTAEPPTEEPTEAPTEAPTAVPTATTAPSTGPTTYVVQEGDNLFRIARQYGTTEEAIAEANGIANPQLIYVGQELTIPTGDAQQPSPGGTTYVVQPGDNLFRIALRYNMDWRQLADYNGIANPANIYVGQVIQIPPQ